MKRAHVLLLVLTLLLVSGAAGRGCAEPAGSGASVPIQPKAITLQFYVDSNKEKKPPRALIHVQIGDKAPVNNETHKLPWQARLRVGPKDFVELVAAVPMFRPGDELHCFIFDKGQPLANVDAYYPDQPAQVDCRLAALTDRLGALPSAHG